MSRKVLLVDDEVEILKDRATLIEGLGYECVTAVNGLEAGELIDVFQPDVILTDQNMPVADGFSVLKTARDRNVPIPVIVFTGFGTIERAVEAMKLGAFDYVKKPIVPEMLESVLSKAVLRSRELKEKSAVKIVDSESAPAAGMVYQSSIMKQIVQNIRRLSHSEANVMIFGESGTGKELIAQTLHAYSKRCEKPLIPLDCVSLPPTLLESELFGFEKGAFTGAVHSKAGIFELAEGGSLFLDEITELDLHLQAKLLRVIQERKLRRVGGGHLLDVDVRLISATNRDPEEAVKMNVLREDLYYRLNVIPVYVPPLRERVDDIPILVHHFIDKHAPSARHPIRGISEKALNCLKHFNWPGNVRQLENVIQRLVSLVDHDVIQAEDLPDNIQCLLDDAQLNLMGYRDARNLKLKEFGRQYLIDLIRKHHGNVSKAARTAGISRATMYRKIRDFGITKQELK